MARLTFGGNFCDIAQCQENFCHYNGSCSQREVWERLKQYEDTELTPEQCQNAKTIVESAFADDTSKAERIRELFKADREGRVVVMPCKVGDTVWIIPDGKKFDFECEVEFVNIGNLYTTIVLRAKDGLREQYGVTTAAFGKTAFLTHEEAEEALRRGLE